LSIGFVSIHGVVRGFAIGLLVIGFLTIIEERKRASKEK
jgi:hypothetical protein